MALIEVTKPGFYKRFIDCGTVEDDLWVARLATSLGCGISRVDGWRATQIIAHYVLPEDTARCMFEMQLYYADDNRTHENGELDGRVGDWKRLGNQNLDLLSAPTRKK